MDKSLRQSLRMAVRHFYDVQIIKNQHAGRVNKAGALLSEEDRATVAEEAKRLAKVEKEAFTRVETLLARIPFYVDVLSKNEPRWKGFGHTMAACILSEVDIEKASTVSKLWRFVGLCPIPCWRCPYCNRILEPADKVKGCDCDCCTSEKKRVERYAKNQHVIDHVGTFAHATKKANESKCEYEGNEAILNPFRSSRAEFTVKGQRRVYSNFAKTKVLGVIGPGLLRSKNEVWRPVYDAYKNRLISGGRGTSDGNRHNASIRYMMKQFLLEIWKEWRFYEGLEVRPTYQEEKLGHKHNTANNSSL